MNKRKVIMMNEPVNLLPHDGAVLYFGKVIDKLESDVLFDRLLNEIHWVRDEVKLFGKVHITAREVAWYADPGLTYTYSGRTKTALPWNSLLLELKQMAEQICGVRFNACLLNLYHDGTEGMGWHSDDEPELGPAPNIASFSFGTERPFKLKHKKEPSQVELNLEHGSLLLMAGACQQYWKHMLPKRARIKTARINLTFRKMGK